MIRKQDKYSAGVYCRLSVDDNNYGESCSIGTQKTILTKHCKDNNFPIFNYYIDDGWSGTNFDRPAFKQMMQDINDGKINLVVVKDLSRFGRDYIEMGIIIERDFEAKNIRFVAVQNDIDTLKGTDNFMMTIYNVFNTKYARECSDKTKIAHAALAKEGKYIGSKAPFGYIKDPDDRHQLIPDPEAAEVVKLIFDMFSQGYGYGKITKFLREKKFLNPIAYFNKNNPDYFKSDYWRQDFDWHVTSIRMILKNPVYLGHTVFGRTENKSFYDKTRVDKPESEWIISENMHEPLVSKDTWDIVQKLMENKRRENKSGEIQMFAGLVKCASCGSSLNVSRKSTGQYTGFSCWVYKNYGKERCTSHAIGWKTLCTLVLEDINRNLRAAKKARNGYIETLTALKADVEMKATDKTKKELNRVNKRLGELDKITSKLYEDNALGKISDDKYIAMSGKYEVEQNELMQKSAELSNQINTISEIYQSIDNFMELIDSHTEIKELSAKILNEFIDKIVVFEKTENPDGSKSQRVDIYYKFIGCIDLIPIAA